MGNLIERGLHVVILLTSLLHSNNLSVQGGPTGQFFIESPQNLTIVNSGEHARLRCIVANKVGECQWTRDGFGLGYDRELPSFPRYLMPKESGKDNVCDLTIDPVLPLDEGTYQCQVSAGPGVPAVITQKVSLVVNSPPGQPHIREAKEVDQIEAEMGELVELHCESQGARPSAEINWINADGERIVSHVTQHVTRIEESKLFSTVSILKFYLQKEEKITCTAQSDAFPIPKTSRSLEVIFGKKPVQEEKLAVEGESFTLDCGDSSGSFDSTYKWFMDGQELENENNSQLEIQEFSKVFDNSLLKCITQNVNGKSKTLKFITLKHRKVDTVAPQAMPLTSKQDKDKRKKKGKKSDSNKKVKKTTFTCIVEEEVTESSEPEYVWMNGKLEQVIKENTINAHDDSNNKIICKVIPNGYKKLKQMAKKMKGMTKSFKKFSKTLDRITETIDVP